VTKKYEALFLLVTFCGFCIGGGNPDDITRAKLRELAGRPFTRFLGELGTQLTLFRAVPKSQEGNFLRPFGAAPEHVSLLRPFMADNAKEQRKNALAFLAEPCSISKKICEGCGICEACRRCEETAKHIRGVLSRMAIKGGKEAALRMAIRDAAHAENVNMLGLGNYQLAGLKEILDERDPSGELYFRLVARGIFTEHALLRLLTSKR